VTFFGFFKIPVLVLTGRTDQAVLSESVNAGAVGGISKCSSPREIVNRIEDFGTYIESGSEESRKLRESITRRLSSIESREGRKH
jgi:DNA-binding NarL/FixJ family response regulator